MSRAFIKEDAGDEGQPERRQPSGPNYVTPRGLKLLRRKVAALEESCAGKSREEQRDLRYWRARLAAAVLIDAPVKPPEDIRFGAVVEVKDAAGKTQTLRIVGQDEAEEEGEGGSRVAWDSAIGRALIGLRAGDKATWNDGEVERQLVVVSVRYLADDGDATVAERQ